MSSKSSLSNNSLSLNREQSIFSGTDLETDEISETRSLNRRVNTFAAIHESETTPFILFRFPKLIFRWFYTFSLVFFIILTMLMVAVTLIDVIAQTSGASLSGLKVFIVIGLCVLFLLCSIIIYLSRMFQKRVALHDIGIKSIYIPGKGDMPHRCCQMIDDNLTWCGEVAVKAGPLNNQTIIINHPGRSPPEYIQKRNKSPFGEGTLFPPDSCYEDIIRSLGDKFKLDGRIMSQVIVPKNLSFREMMIYIVEKYENVLITRNIQLVTDVNTLIELYEKFKFGPDLIEESEMIEFILLFDKIVRYLQFNYVEDSVGGNSTTISKPTKSIRGTSTTNTNTSKQQSKLSGKSVSNQNSLLNVSFLQNNRSHSFSNFGGQTDESSTRNSVTSIAQPHFLSSQPSRIPSLKIIDPLHNTNQFNSSTPPGNRRSSFDSVIKTPRISFRHRQNSKDDDDSVNRDIGYVTDSEDDDEEYGDDDDNNEDSFNFYSFRRRNIK